MTDSLPAHRARIAAAFAGADRYDEAASVQRAVAAALALRIAAAFASRAATPPRILELGCGTGFLTRALAELIGRARWTVSDIAPAMVERARAALTIHGDYRTIDGEAIDPALGRFDLIASSLAFQWFADLPGALQRMAALLETPGLIAFSTMAEGSFPEWTAALAAEGLPSGLPRYPDRAALAALAPPGPARRAQLPARAQGDRRGHPRRGLWAAHPRVAPSRDGALRPQRAHDHLPDRFLPFQPAQRLIVTLVSPAAMPDSATT